MTQIHLTKAQVELFEDFLLKGPTSHTVLRTFVPIRPGSLSDVLLPTLIHGVFKTNGLCLRILLFLPGLTIDILFLPVRLITWIPSAIYNGCKREHKFILLLRAREIKSCDLVVILDCPDCPKHLFKTHHIALRALPYALTKPNQPNRQTLCHAAARQCLSNGDYKKALSYAEQEPFGIMHEIHTHLKSVKNPPTEVMLKSHLYQLKCALKGPDIESVTSHYQAMQILKPDYVHEKAAQICFDHYLALAKQQTDPTAGLSACNLASKYKPTSEKLIPLRQNFHLKLAIASMDRPQIAKANLLKSDQSSDTVKCYQFMLEYSTIDYNKQYDHFLTHMPEPSPTLKPLAANICAKAGDHCYKYGPNNPSSRFDNYKPALAFYTKANQLHPTQQYESWIQHITEMQAEIESATTCTIT